MICFVHTISNITMVSMVDAHIMFDGDLAIKHERCQLDEHPWMKPNVKHLSSCLILLQKLCPGISFQIHHQITEVYSTAVFFACDVTRRSDPQGRTRVCHLGHRTPAMQ